MLDTCKKSALALGLALAALICAAPICASSARAEDGPPSIVTSVPALAPYGDFKKMLADDGVTLQNTYIGEVLGNPTGGARQGVIGEGRLDTVFEFDMGKFAHLNGGTVHAEGFWIQGVGLSRYYLNNLLPVSYIEAMPTIRLYELWYEQKLFDDKVAVRIGQLGADTDFVSSKYAQLFINSTTGWPGLLAWDMPSGGPAYPFSALGARVKYDINDTFTYVVAVYDGNPAGPGPGDPQVRDPYGLNFRLTDPPLVMQELQIKYNQDKDASGLAGTIKLGAWRNFGMFNDVDGRPFVIAGLPVPVHSGDYGFYGMIDQQLIRAPGDATKGLGAFFRAFTAPGDRNVSDFYFDTGVNLSGFVDGRPNDIAGLCFAFMRISNATANSVVEAGFPYRPDFEALVEATYQAQVVPGLSVQPVVQYVIHPGAQLDGGYHPNALVLGVRSTVNF